MSLSPIFDVTPRDETWKLTPHEWLDNAISNYVKIYDEIEDDDGRITDAPLEIRLQMVNTEIAIARALKDLA